MPTQVELSTLANSVTKNHDQSLVQIAIFKQLTITLLNRYAEAHRINLDAQLELANLCVNAYLRDAGLKVADMQNALSAVIRAGQTSQYLASLPD